MARPSKSGVIDYGVSRDLTYSLIERARCPSPLPYVLLRDANKKGLRVRVTKAGGKHWQFETRLRSGKLFTRALGEFPTISIEQARQEAHALRGLTEKGVDPRDIERQEQQVKEAAIAETEAHALLEAQVVAANRVTVEDAWKDYIEKRRPYWGETHYRDHIYKANAGGVPSQRRGHSNKLTKPGPLAELMPLKLIDLDQQTIAIWATKEGKIRATSSRLAWRLLKVFLNWCSEQPEYTALLPAKNPAETLKAREALGKAGTKKDVLQRGQLKAWFSAVQKIGNPTISACLQVLLLSGARLNEILSMKWENVNTQWKGIHIHDKIEKKAGREIPLTPYMEYLISSLPHRNDYVFASVRALDMSEININRRNRKNLAKGVPLKSDQIQVTSTKGYISVPNTQHTRACQSAGLEGLTLHGLRRSFKSLTEWVGVPVGIVAQIQGHKPSATAEKHYTIRPLELLALHHQQIELWILEQAEINFQPQATRKFIHAVST